MEQGRPYDDIRENEHLRLFVSYISFLFSFSFNSKFNEELLKRTDPAPGQIPSLPTAVPSVNIVGLDYNITFQGRSSEVSGGCRRNALSYPISADMEGLMCRRRHSVAW